MRLKVGVMEFEVELDRLEVRISGFESKSVSRNILYQCREV